VNIKTVEKWLGKKRLEKVENIFIDEWYGDGVGIEIWLKDDYIVDGYYRTTIEFVKQEDETWQDIKNCILYEFNQVIKKEEVEYEL
jgi:hypothetical protein